MKNILPLEQYSETMLAEEPEGIKIKQIWESPYLNDLGTVSYDGRWRSCVDWGVGNLALHDLKSGQIRKLTHTASLGDTGNFVLNTAISKNGKQIVSTWWRPHNTTDLVLTNVEDNTSEILYSQKGEEVYPSAWLSDNEFVALKFNKLFDIRYLGDTELFSELRADLGGIAVNSLPAAKNDIMIELFDRTA